MIDPMMSTWDHEFAVSNRRQPHVPDFALIQSMVEAAQLLDNFRQQCSADATEAWDKLWNAREYLIEQFDAADPSFRGVCVHCHQGLHHDSYSWVHEGERNGMVACHRNGKNLATPHGMPTERPQYEGQEAA